MTPVLLAETTRRTRDGGELVESRHLGTVVLRAPDGRVAAFGDGDRLTFLRSAVKPWQAAASLELAGDASVSDEETAVGWASHRAEPDHRRAVTAICRRIDLDPDDLTPPPDVPEDDPTASPSPVHYNCSGKHALFALAGAAVGVSGRAVLDPTGPVQRHVLAAIAEGIGAPVAAISVDGCGAPAVAAPLGALARGFQRLAAGEERWRRVVEAGYRHPRLVGGTGRLESALLARRIVAKPGAEGIYGVGWVDGDGGPWGLAIKVEDGAGRAASAAVHGLLVALGVVTADVWSPAVVRGGGQPIGTVRVAGTLVEAVLAGRSQEQAPVR